ncbi:MAG: hypothetical protein ABWK01_09660 [Infirmifilum sp.]
MSTQEIIYIGEKPASGYIVEILTLLKKGREKIILKARGPNISKAAGIAESVKKMTGNKIKYGEIKLYSEEVGEEAEEKMIPVLEIEIISLL